MAATAATASASSTATNGTHGEHYRVSQHTVEHEVWSEMQAQWQRRLDTIDTVRMVSVIGTTGNGLY